MAKFCIWCGAQAEDDAVFCPNCGKRVDGADAMQQPPQQQQPIHPPMAPQGYSAPRGKSRNGLVIGLVAAALALVVGVGGFVWPGFFRGGEEAETEEVSDRKSDGKDRDSEKEETKPHSVKPKDEEKPKEDENPAEEKNEEESHDLEEIEPIIEVEPPVDDMPYVNPFTDVQEGEWYYDALMWAGKNGIVNGTEFDPSGRATRAQALTFLWRASGSPASNLPMSPYIDVTPDKYFYQPVLWSFEHGLVATAEDGRFHADDTLNRAQAITFLYRAVDSEDFDLEQSFSDVKPGDWYYDAANWAYGAGVVGRNENFTFEGDAPVTRAQFVTFMHRAFVREASLWNQTDA